MLYLYKFIPGFWWWLFQISRAARRPITHCAGRHGVIQGQRMTTHCVYCPSLAGRQGQLPPKKTPRRVGMSGSVCGGTSPLLFLSRTPSSNPSLTTSTAALTTETYIQ
ncbi:hypothetical protein K461DRAFT_2449 [Myriangium duriaei CBS 260.36]|uniref:Uncharacterized protein n=1 Tax=Myriangium duriaei CBS 260.36 TaxID=1168546 RepID=A0A9P4MKU5_9PEZI|nr:hypothetical protein K461DRAFT_2449 [Myriangium duriaei CBS 260.36]